MDVAQRADVGESADPFPCLREAATGVEHLAHVRDASARTCRRTLDPLVDQAIEKRHPREPADLEVPGSGRDDFGLRSGRPELNEDRTQTGADFSRRRAEHAF